MTKPEPNDVGRPDSEDSRDIDTPDGSAGEGALRPPGDRRREDAERDEALDDSFPASDPPPASPGAD
jgi:hypothetical protein